jgi:hypothetical protein
LLEWPPKTTLYRHKPGYNIDGEIVFEVGTTVVNVPGNPDYVLPKSRIGLFPWPPSSTCKCRWCAEVKPVKAKATEETKGDDVITDVVIEV